MQAVWIEIPVEDLDRALAFYQSVFQLESVETVDDGVRRTATITNTTEQGAPGISLNKTANFAPGSNGPLVYLDAGEDLTDALQRVEPAGGKVIEGKTSMGDAGNYATVSDSEGNTLALYSYR